LNGLAGTIGFPTISARASDLETLVAGARGRRVFAASAARDAVAAIRNAFAKDVAEVSTPRGSTSTIAEAPSVPASDESGDPAREVGDVASHASGAGLTAAHHRVADFGLQPFFASSVSHLKFSRHSMTIAADNH
jgi:hypothetical protein